MTSDGFGNSFWFIIFSCYYSHGVIILNFCSLSCTNPTAILEVPYLSNTLYMHTSSFSSPLLAPAQLYCRSPFVLDALTDSPRTVLDRTQPSHFLSSSSSFDFRSLNHPYCSRSLSPHHTPQTISVYPLSSCSLSSSLR